MNLEAPVYECYSHGAAFGVRLPSGEQTAALFADIRAAQAVADYFTAVELAPKHLSCVMEEMCIRDSTCTTRRSTTCARTVFTGTIPAMVRSAL